MTKPRILVLGDAMLDLRTEGTATRLSPEAPVPVLRIANGHTTPTLGGAANVAANVVSLGGSACLIAVTGQDAAAETMGRLARAAGVRDRFSVDAGRSTTQKHRFVTGDRHLLRVDQEADGPVGEDAQRYLLSRFEAEIFKKSDAIILSDYGKGVLTVPVLTQVIAMANEGEVPVVVDPKRLPLHAYRHATAITPNIHEAVMLSGIGDSCTDEGAAAAALAILTRNGHAAVVVTRSEKGVTLAEWGRGPNNRHLVTHHPSLARRVVDVTGAGDSFVAAFALELARGSSYEEAARKGQEAAAVAVSRLGTVAVVLNQPKEDSIVGTANHWRGNGLSVGFICGCFDVLHAGHIHLLRMAKESCDRLIVAVNDDASVRRLNKSHPLIQPLEDRMAVLGALVDYVDAVVAFSEDTPLNMIRTVKPDVLFRGDDGTEAVGAEFAGQVVRVPLLVGRSTTETWRRATSPSDGRRATAA